MDVVPNEDFTLLQLPLLFLFCRYKSKSAEAGPVSCAKCEPLTVTVYPVVLGLYDDDPVDDSVPVYCV